MVLSHLRASMTNKSARAGFVNYSSFGEKRKGRNSFAYFDEVIDHFSGDSMGGLGGPWPPRFLLGPCLVLPVFFNFPFKFIWLTYTVDDFRPAIF